MSDDPTRALRSAVLDALAAAPTDATRADLARTLAHVLDAHLPALVERLDRAERLATVGQLCGSVAHELRNPLSVIETSAFIIGERARGDERVARHTRRIADQVALAGGIVGELLDAARGRPNRTDPIDLGASICAAVSQVPCPVGASVRIEMPPELPRVSGDERRIRQVVTILVVNGLEATDSKGNVVVRAKVEGETVRVTVSDDGPGIPAAVLPRLFEPLYTTKPNGTGLGLAIAKQIVRAHGGEIVATNRDEGGARFEVTLPIAPVSTNGDAV